MTNTAREKFEVRFPVPTGVGYSGEEYVWLGGNHHYLPCSCYNEKWIAWQSALEQRNEGVEVVYQVTYSHDGTWLDATKKMYESCYPSDRRILYASPPTVEKENKDALPMD